MAVVAEAALNTLKNQSMIGVVIKRDFEKLPVTFKDNEDYAVTGFWHLSKIFALKHEEQDDLGRVQQQTWLMGCLVYSGPRDSMWWTLLDQDTRETVVYVWNSDEAIDEQFEKQQCSTCGELSITIFQEGWVCTNRTCAKLCMDASGNLLKEPSYLKKFLMPRIAVEQFEQEEPPLLPKPMEELPLVDDEAQNFKYMRDFWRGWVCPDCQTMNRRVHYEKSLCDCGYSHPSRLPHVSLDRVVGDRFLTLDEGDNPPHKKIKSSPVELVEKLFNDEFAIYTWEFCPGARVTALYPRAELHQGPDGNNTIFEELQKKTRSGAISVNRATFGDNGHLDCITRHFCANFGKDYKPKLVVTTTPFEDADPLIPKLVSRGKAVVSKILGREVDFNEALCLAYLPEMSIGWHNDGEAGLGDVIVSHSFGASSTMSFAMKADYYTGRTTSNKKLILTPDDPHLPGCQHMEERRDLLSKHEQGELAKEQYETELKEIVKKHKVNRERVSPKLLSITIPHGAYVIMHGETMQKYYQHSADCEGLMRFVITMRYIGDDHEDLMEKKPSRKPAHAVPSKKTGAGSAAARLRRRKRKLEEMDETDGADGADGI